MLRRLKCGCIDERRGNRWAVFVLCPAHTQGRTPVQDEVESADVDR